jgi:sugar phosphate isomerase/epimerase
MLKMRDFSNDTTALALNTATLGHNLDGFGAGWSPEQVIDACAERGFGGITFWRRELKNNAHQIGNYARAAGLTVAGLCRTPYLTGRDSGSDQELMASIETAAELGAEVLTIVTGGTDPQTKGILDSQKNLANRLFNLCEFSAQHFVKLALEPLNPMFGGNRTCVMTVDDALRVCDMVGSPNLGIAVDVYHVWWDSQLNASLGHSKGRVFGYHLCDWLENTSDMLLDRGMMGDGVADLRAIRQAVEATGYNGFCEVEIFSSQNWWLRDPNFVLDTIVDRYKDAC